MNKAYFIWGLFSTLSLNTFFTQLVDSLLAASVSLLGGLLSSILVAWLKERWHDHRKQRNGG